MKDGMTGHVVAADPLAGLCSTKKRYAHGLWLTTKLYSAKS